MADSSKGFLTGTDKGFLRGDVEYDRRQSRYQRRRAIRERTRAAFADLAFLYHHIGAEGLAKIFHADDTDDRFPAGYFPTAMALMIRSFNPDPPAVYPEAGRAQPAFDEFFSAVESGVETFLASEHGLDAEAATTLELSDVRDAEELAATLEGGERPSLATLATLELAGIDTARFTDGDGPPTDAVEDTEEE